MSYKQELLTKATQTTDLLLSDLREANSEMNPVEHLIILDLIEKTAEIQVRLTNMNSAIKLMEKYQNE